MFSRIVKITGEVPVTVLQAYITFPRHLRKAVLIRRIIASLFVQQLVASNFGKNGENVKRELCLNVIIILPSLFVALSLRDIPKTVFWVNRIIGSAPLPPSP